MGFLAERVQISVGTQEWNTASNIDEFFSNISDQSNYEKTNNIELDKFDRKQLTNKLMTFLEKL